MKKTVSLILKISAGLVALIVVLLFIIPILFKDKIKVKVEQAISSSVNARVEFRDYSLSFFRHFPNLSFSLSNLTVAGTGAFQNDTLADVKNFSLVFDLASVFKKTGYAVRSVLIDKAIINTIVLKDGKANWDIAKESEPSAQQAQTSSDSSPMHIKLSKVVISNSKVLYTDFESDMQATLAQLDLAISGDMTGGKTDLKIEGKSGEFTYIMEKMKYIDRAVVNTKMDLLADIDSMKFVFRDNYLALNDLKLNFTGTVKMPGDDITTDLSFKTVQSSLGSLLSLIPAVYMKDYNDLKTTGNFQLSGTAKGIYSDKDSTMPDVSLDLNVTDGTINYPSLPDQIKNINILSKVFFDGKVTDRSLVNVEKFHLEFAGNPFDMTLSLKTPVSDPDFNASMTGKLDLKPLMKVVGMDSIKIAGLIDIHASMAGRMSMIEKQQYESFKASGTMGIMDFSVAMTGYPEVKIPKADFQFSPSYAALNNGTVKVGKNSDFELNGRISDYLPYVFRNKTLKGTLSSHSSNIDVTELMSGMSSSGTSTKDTVAASLVRVPSNIDFELNAAAEKFVYGNIKGTNAKGRIIVRDGVLSLKETGMDILSGRMVMNADYDTRDSLKPFMKADLDISNIAIKESFNTFNTVKSLAPAARGIDGNVSLKMGFQSLLKNDWMPVTNSIGGEGKLKSDEITLLESGTFDKIKDVLKLGNNYSNRFKDVNVSFRIVNGRIYVNPFDIRTGNLKMNISGDQGIDQTINYVVKTEMPRSDLGGSVNALIDNLASQAAVFGIKYKPSETIKVNLKVTGTFSKPVVAPIFGKQESQASQSVVPAGTDYAKEKARTEAEKEAARLIKEAGDKAEILNDEAEKTADAIRKEAGEKAKKLVDDSAGKSQLEKLAAQKAADALKKNADKKADQLVKEADNQGKKLIEEARKKGDELIKKI